MKYLRVILNDNKVDIKSPQIDESTFIDKYVGSKIKGDAESGMNRFPDNQVKLYLVGTSDGKGSISIQNGHLH